MYAINPCNGNFDRDLFSKQSYMAAVSLLTISTENYSKQKNHFLHRPP